MIELPDGTVLLHEGEPFPARCGECDRLYTPPLGSEVSRCPHCGERSEHHEQEWSFVDPAEDP
jgi:uncharacterized OB-fold protein